MSSSSEEQIFETPDQPLEEEKQEEEELGGENVIVEKLDISKAKHRFKGASLSSDEPRRLGDRLQRLVEEANELQSLLKGQDDLELLDKIYSQLRSQRREVPFAQIEQFVGEFTRVVSIQEDKRVLKDIPEKSVESSNLSSLESKLANLETTLGLSSLAHIDNDSFPFASLLLASSSSILTALARLESHILLLSDPKALSSLKDRIKNLSSDLEKLIDLRKRYSFETSLTFQQDTETEKTLSSINASLKKVEPVAEVLPHVVTRLRALKPLHAEFAECVRTVRYLSDSQNKMEDKIKAMQGDMQSLMESMKVNEERVLKGLKAIEERVSCIQGK